MRLGPRCGAAHPGGPFLFRLRCQPSPQNSMGVLGSSRNRPASRAGGLRRAHLPGVPPPGRGHRLPPMRPSARAYDPKRASNSPKDNVFLAFEGLHTCVACHLRIVIAIAENWEEPRHGFHTEANRAIAVQARTLGSFGYSGSLRSCAIAWQRIQFLVMFKLTSIPMNDCCAGALCLCCCRCFAVGVRSLTRV